MRSLRFRLLATTAAVLAIVLGALVLVSSRLTRVEFRKFQDVVVAGRHDNIAPALRSLVEGEYRRAGSWKNANAAAARAAAALRRDIFILDAADHPVGRSPGLAGASIEKGPGGGIRVEWAGGGARRMVWLRAPGVAVTDSAGLPAGRVFSLDREPDGPPDVRSLNRWLAAAVAAAGVAALLLVAAVARRVLGPIEALTAAAREMERGDLSRRVAVSSRDEIGELARSFNAMADAVSRNEALRRALVHDVAHELRTPLTNIRAQIEGIQDGLTRPDASVVDSIHEDALLLERLVDDLQDLAAAETGQLGLRPRRIETAGALAAAAAAIATRAQNDGVAVSVRSTEDIPAVRADPARLAQIIGNLLSNAVTHTPPGGRVEVGATRCGREVEIFVSDTGTGIAPEHLPHVFERFYRADPSRARRSGGTGLGLAIVRQLVEAQGGRARVESKPGEGARFAFTLPEEPETGTEPQLR
ncbi:MAG: ATP-binding protein [Acidobacteriota bacterium]